MSNTLKTLFGLSVAFFLFSNASFGYGYLVNEHGYPADGATVMTILILSVVIVFASIVLIGLFGLVAVNSNKSKDDDFLLVPFIFTFIIIIACGILAFLMMCIDEAVPGHVTPSFRHSSTSALFLNILVGIGLGNGFILWIIHRRNSWIYFLGMLLCGYSFFLSHWIASSIIYVV